MRFLSIPGLLFLFFMGITVAKRELHHGSSQLNYTVEIKLCDPGSPPSGAVIELQPDIVYAVNPGNFCLVENVTELTIRGNDPSNPSVIQCFHDGDIISRGFGFLSVDNLTIENVIFEDCGMIISDGLIKPANDSTFIFGLGQASVLFCSHCVNFNLHNVRFTNYTGYAVVGINTLGDTHLDNVIVTDNNKHHSDDICHRRDRTHVCKGSGILFMFINSSLPVVSDLPLHSLVTISNSYFNNNTADHALVDNISSEECVDSIFDRRFAPNVGALTVLVDRDQFQNVHFNFVGLNFTDNHGQCYGAVLIVFLTQSDVSEFTFSNCTFFGNTPSLLSNGTEQGRNYFGTDITAHLRFHGNFTSAYCVSVEDSEFHGSEKHLQAPRIALLHFSGSNGNCTALLRRVVATNTKFLYAFAVDQSSDRFGIEIHGLKVIGRRSDFNLQSLTLDNGLLTFARTTLVVINGTDEYPCLFENLIGPAIIGRVTDIVLTGNVTFRNINAANWAGGAAIMLSTDSHLWLKEPLIGEFCNLTARAGGAIHAPERITDFCVIQFVPEENRHYNSNNIADIDIHLTFTTNTARLAGNSMYIDPLWNCSFQISPHFDFKTNETTLVYDSVFDFEVSNGTQLLEMASNPRMVCICKNGPNDTRVSALNCHQGPIEDHLVTTYPGKQFTLTVIAVNDLRKRVYSTVYTNLFQNEINSKFDWRFRYDTDVTQMYGIMCSEITYIILTNNPSRRGFLSLTPADTYQSLIFPILVLECPIGFQRTPAGSCDCSPMLKYLQLQCNIDTQLFDRRPSTWIGIVPQEEDDSESNVTIGYSVHCPTRYCTHDRVNVVRISESDTLCRYNRTGILCGQCPGNLSAVVGSPQCLECSHWWLFTILLYALAGVLLVLILFILRISVVTGTINGLIFFANLFNINSYTFFDHKGVHWLRVFLAFLNLELGFPICLYNGMDELAKAHLSFVFPIYLWTIGIALIVAARCSSRIAKLTSRTAVPILATLIHLSFFQLLRSVVDGLTFSNLLIEHQFPDYHNETLTVWYYDGNVKYLEHYHILLFIFALVTLVFFLIPYTMVLTGVKYTTRFRIINRFQPIIDAICAPYKDRWRFCFGVRLWVLIIVYIVFAASRNEIRLFLFIQSLILMILTFAQLAIMPYKSTAVNILDLFFLADASLLSVSALYSDDYFSLVSGIFVGAVFVVFWCIIGYHVWSVVEHKLPLALCRRRMYGVYEKLLTSHRDSYSVTVNQPETSIINQSSGTPKRHRFDELRESILASSSD